MLMIHLQWLYVKALVKFWWDYFFSTELVEIQNKNPHPFNMSANPPHWMDISTRQVYGMHDHQHWCDPNTIDSDEHHRAFFDKRHVDTFFPQGQPKWFVGNHWRDYLFTPFIFHINPLSEPKNYAYDLGYPSYRAMNACYEYLASQGKNMFTISKSVLRGLFAFALTFLVGGVILFSSLHNRAEAQVPEPQYPASYQSNDAYLLEQLRLQTSIKSQNKRIEDLIAQQRDLQAQINDLTQHQLTVENQLIDKLDALDSKPQSHPQRRYTQKRHKRR